MSEKNIDNTEIDNDGSGVITPMPEWAKIAKERGSNIQFLHGKWKIAFAD